MPQNVQSKAGDEAIVLDAAQGLVVDSDDPTVLRRAIDLAFDYRGDVTLLLKDRDEPLTGYVFDRSAKALMDDSLLRILPADGSERQTVAYSSIARLEFSGRDTAAGKSFETWMRKYVEKKLAGEEASIHGAAHEEDRPDSGA